MGITCHPQSRDAQREHDQYIHGKEAQIEPEETHLMPAEHFHAASDQRPGRQLRKIQEQIREQRVADTDQDAAGKAQKGQRDDQHCVYSSVLGRSHRERDQQGKYENELRERKVSAAEHSSVRIAAKGAEQVADLDVYS